MFACFQQYQDACMAAKMNDVTDPRHYHTPLSSAISLCKACHDYMLNILRLVFKKYFNTAKPNGDCNVITSCAADPYDTSTEV